MRASHLQRTCALSDLLLQCCKWGNTLTRWVHVSKSILVLPKPNFSNLPEISCYLKPCLPIFVSLIWFLEPGREDVLYSAAPTYAISSSTDFIDYTADFISICPTSLTLIWVRTWLRRMRDVVNIKIYIKMLYYSLCFFIMNNMHIYQGSK